MTSAIMQGQVKTMFKVVNAILPIGAREALRRAGVKYAFSS